MAAKTETKSAINTNEAGTKTNMISESETKNPLRVLAYSALNAIILNIVIAALLWDALSTIAFFIVTGLLLVLTFVSIISIEALTHFAVKQQGGRINFWKQLDVTNNYLTLPFILFLILGAIILVLPIGDIRFFGADGLVFAIAMVMNYKKLKSIVGLKSVVIPMVVYGIGAIIAYAIWCGILVSFMLLSYIATSGA